MSLARLKPEIGFYVIGGTLHRDAPCYVERRADHQLYDFLRQGRFCYVLTSRQMGKSSLMVRTAARLREGGAGVTVLDLTAIGQNLSAEQWYRGLLDLMGLQLELEDELIEFWREQRHLGPLQRWTRAIREIILPRYQQQGSQVVVFVDEIDAVRNLPFSTDEFFAAIREFYNRRTEDEELERLTFCLLGVATPADLIHDTRTTPFNIGQRIELHDFTAAEARSLSAGLNCGEQVAASLLERIHYWTNGHPYLTQRLCHAAANPQSAIRNLQSVDRLCEEMFFAPRARERDDNLLFVRERLLRSEVELAGLLNLYEQVRCRKRVRDDETDPLVSALRLSGITRVEQGCLRERNRIYARVFDRAWIKANMPDAEQRRQRAAFRRGLWRAAAISAVIVALMAGLIWLAMWQRNRALRQEAASRRLLYVAHMNLAQQDWETANLGRMQELLASHLPKPGEEDLRGFEWYYLWRLCHGNVLSLPQTGGGVAAVAFSPGGDKVATAGSGRFVKIWEANTGRELTMFTGHAGIIRRLAFSPDGAKLVSVSDDKTAKLCEVATERILATLGGDTHYVRAAAFSPDSSNLVTVSRDGTAKLWDAATGQESFTFKERLGPVNRVEFSPNGALLVVRGQDDTVKLWVMTAGKLTLKLQVPHRLVQSTAFSPDGARLASASADKTIKLWDVATGREQLTLSGHTEPVFNVAFSPDGSKLATVGRDRTARLWDARTGQQLTTFKGHASELGAVTFSPDGTRLVTGGKDDAAKVWEVSAQHKPLVLKNAWTVAFAPDSRKLVTGSPDTTAKLWDVVAGRELLTLSGHAKEVGVVAYSPDGRKVATVSFDHTAKLWDTATGRELAALRGHKGIVRSAAFSPDGALLATVGEDRLVKLWDAATARELMSLSGHTDKIFSVAFSPDGAKLATGCLDDTARLWETSTGRELATLKGHTNWVWAVAFSPTGARLATASEDQTVKLWEVATGRELATLKGHGNAVTAIGFSADGKRLASGGRDNSVRLWDLATNQEVLTLKDRTEEVWPVVFSPDGRLLAAGGGDRSIIIWRAATEQEVALHNR